MKHYKAKKLSKKIIDIVEGYDFCVYSVELESNASSKDKNSFYVELNQSTPEGEDWHETIYFDGTDEGFVEAARDRAYGFDVDDEAEVWVDMRGKSGVPSSIKKLIQDAEWKKNLLLCMAGDLSTALYG